MIYASRISRKLVLMLAIDRLMYRQIARFQLISIRIGQGCLKRFKEKTIAKGVLTNSVWSIPLKRGESRGSISGWLDLAYIQKGRCPFDTHGRCRRSRTWFTNAGRNTARTGCDTGDPRGDRCTRHREEDLGTQSKNHHHHRFRDLVARCNGRNVLPPRVCQGALLFHPSLGDSVLHHPRVG